MIKTKVIYKILLCSVFFLSLGTFASALGQKGPVEAELTYDGMLPVKVKSLDSVWVRKDASLTSFGEIMLETAEIQYRPVEPFTHRWSIPTNRTEFPISEAGRDRLQKMLGDTFAKELEKSKRFTIAREAGPGVAKVRVTLLDVVSNAPPELAGRNEIYLSSVGEATLIIEIYDSETNTILARAVDRRAADSPGWELTKSTPVSNWFEAQKVMQSWASILRYQLDNVAENLDGE